MSYSQKTAFSILAIAIISIFNTPTLANPDSFYRALEKTRKQHYTQAIRELESLGRQFKQRGDLVNAYRNQATAVVIRYERDSLAKVERDGSALDRDWETLGTIWDGNTNIGTGRDGNTNIGVGSFTVSFMEPPTAIKNFGGLIVFGRVSKYVGKQPIYGFLDTKVVPKLKANESVVYSCQITSGFRANKPVFALATYNTKLNSYTKIRQAWYPNIKTERIQSIDPSFVKCEYNSP
jgi:hypothetical protein